MGTDTIITLTFLLLITLISLGVLFYRWRQANKHIQFLEATVYDLKHEGGYQTLLALESEVNRLKEQHQIEIANLSSRIKKKQIKTWLREVTNAQYHNEIEVEVKFIYPLVKFLGYQDKQIRLRETVQGLFGRQKFVGEVDWTIRSTDSKPILVIEAKAPSVTLDRSVEEQARSYAFVLNAPLYMITNGKEIKVFKRNAQGDRCIIDISVKHLYQKWDLFTNVLSVDKLSVNK